MQVEQTGLIISLVGAVERSLHGHVHGGAGVSGVAGTEEVMKPCSACISSLWLRRCEKPV